MTRRARQWTLSATVAVSALLLVLFVTSGLARDPERPEEVQPLARWVAERPADWLAASALSDRALDSDLPRRRELWLAAYAHAEQLAPNRPNTAAGFVRGGLFHWNELGPKERKAVLDVAATLMNEPRVFEQMHLSLWQLTRDFPYLRRIAPKTMEADIWLRDLALANGLFAEYRDLRTTARNLRLVAFQARRTDLPLRDLLSLLPQRLDTDEIPMLREILEELHERAFDPQQATGRMDEVAVFAIEHGLQPLAGLSTFVEAPNVLRDVTRARLALALGNRTAAARIELTTAVAGAKEWIPYYRERAEYEAQHGDAALAAVYRDREAFTARGETGGWSGLCGEELCTSAFREHEGPLSVALSVTQSDEVPPYVEIYVDDALVAEGEVHDERTFAVDAGPGRHRTEVRLVNPRTRNGIQRRARLS
ncbi:MAG TPA: hypothetical protein VE974_29825 [Thermoanaerobaculia bacterium]|nr:hypothetical protein [Thermoanaerobaculia bacterium]